MAPRMKAASVPGLNTWMRPRSRHRAHAMFLGFMAFCNAALSLVVAVMGRSLDEGAAAAMLLVVAAGCGVVAYRTYHAGLWIAADGIVIRGPLWTSRVAVDAAESFFAGVQDGAGNGTPCPMLATGDGRAIGVWALGRQGVVWRYPRYLRELEPVCTELNRLLECAKAKPRSVPPARSIGDRRLAGA